MYSDKNEMVIEFTERADKLLHMILDLKRDKEVDLYQMQTLVLNMYKDEIMLLNELERRKRRVLEIPNFMVKKEAQ